MRLCWRRDWSVMAADLILKVPTSIVAGSTAAGVRPEGAHRTTLF